MSATARVVAISGGIGGAKLALGLYRALPADSLMVACNTGDDFEHLGLSISPDLDTVLYTLAGIANPDTGWGRAGETWTFMQALESLGGETWFRLGDADLATHVERTCRLAAGEKLSAISEDFCTRLGVRARVVPMSDEPVRTMVHTDEGILPFQRYFVQNRCEPRVTGFSFHGAGDAHPSLPLWEALLADRLEAVVICPSNPFISIDPILAVPGLRGAIGDCGAPVVAVSPIIGGRAVKGPTAKMMAELGIPRSARAVAEHYEGLLTGFVLDESDEGAVGDLPCLTTRILMETEEDKTTLARQVLDFAGAIADKVR
ncbi:MAG: 2-phospho-L-lactate transferase [Gammaproteobacteria bacterium]|nr:2-phospho-L-lactate transferase [Gammaproteobacteria bacterium]NIM73046.1 2-phospho-L-lactate transferase [Gammaproteobacteria bacterium]NIN38663.1 2-phospho-L-lactate transferase [Gammaproteobacteria bacterium]NIO24799.1 2-phospho-L-lactate transferase [Gammaproteobacteria bacterium]NIO65402.1 2-phospho-L-lactate transferase [Gammaproteobacteria bacterium]